MKLQHETIALPPGQSFRLLRWNDNVHDVEWIPMAGQAKPFEGAGTVWHFHPEFEITLVTRGSGTRFIGDSIAAFNTMDLVLIGTGVPHYWHGLHDSSGYAIQFSLSEAHPLGRLEETSELDPLWADAGYGLQFSGATRQQVTDLITAMPEQRGVRRFASFLSVLDTLMSAPESERCRLSRKALATSKRLNDSIGIQKAIIYIVNHLQDDLTLADVLNHTGMSKATFSRHFINHTGKTFTQFLRETRIDYAARQLVESEHSIGEIAFAAGFNNLSHFNHSFRAIHGCTPREFSRRKTAGHHAPGKVPPINSKKLPTVADNVL